MNVNEKIKLLLEQKEMTQKQFASMLQIPYTTLNGYLRGTYQPDFEIFKKMAEILQVSSDYLLGIAPASSTSLNEQEFRFIQQFRQLTEEQQELILQQIGLMTSQNSRLKQTSSTLPSQGKKKKNIS